MFDIIATFPTIKVDINGANYNLEHLGDRVLDTLVNNTKLALISFGKIATGTNLKAIHGVRQPSRQISRFGFAASGNYKAQVVGDHSLRYIIHGRRPGGKMPVRVVGIFDPRGRGSQYRGRGTGRFVRGIGSRGGRLFEPFPAMQRWFEVFRIPRDAWFPIMRAIARRGIPPKDIPGKALEMARPAILAEVALAKAEFGRGIFNIQHF